MGMVQQDWEWTPFVLYKLLWSIAPREWRVQSFRHSMASIRLQLSAHSAAVHPFCSFQVTDPSIVFANWPGFDDLLYSKIQ